MRTKPTFLRKVLSSGATFAVAIASGATATAGDLKVNDAAELRAALTSAKPGMRLLLAGGNYGAGFHFTNVRGEQDRPIIIAAADPKQPPIFQNGNTGLQFSNPAYVELQDLVFTKLAQNGLNIDDGGLLTNASARGIVLRRLRIRDIGSDGNHDGIKLSGLWDFHVEDCTIERWGTKGGSAIDMVGCHRGVIDGCTIRHNDPEPPNCTGVQAKGGSSDLVIRQNRFEHAGGRAVNIGGSTGLNFFRPPLVAGVEQAEARNLRIEGNIFIGSMAPVAFVGVDGASVRFNTIEKPGRWVLRILQENTSPGFVASRNGEFSDNTVVFDSAHWSEGGVNIGAGTAPATFKFARNWWLCSDRPDRSRPRLPTTEVKGAYGRPIAEAKGKAGADAYQKAESTFSAFVAPAGSDYFPPPESQGGWRTLDKPEDIRGLAGVNPDQLGSLRQWLLDSDQRPFAAVIVRHGYVVLEVERGNSAKTDARRVASVSKAVCATVLAIASDQSQHGLTPRKMKFEDPAFEFLPWAQPLSDPRKAKITVKQLLNHTSGICPEATGAPNDGSWEYLLGHTGDARTANLAFDPGTACGYSTHAMAHAALVCETVTGKPYDQFAIEALFRPIGVEHWWFQFYDGGPKYGRHPSHGLGMPARDLARIAYCMLRGGRWNEAQVIPKWFVDESANATHSVKTPEQRWKLNAQIFSHGWELPARLTGEGGRSGDGIPADARAKPGSGGQYIAFAPSLDLVITRQTGSSGEWGYEEYLRRACALVLDKRPGP